MKTQTRMLGLICWHWLHVLLLLNCPSSCQENLRPDKTDYSTGALPHLIYSLPEESPRGTIIAKLRDDIETMFGGHQPVSPQGLQITNWQDRGPRNFGIEPHSGYLIVNAQPNREALCPDNTLPTGFSLPSLSQPGPLDGKFGSSNAVKRGHQRLTSPAAPDRPCSLLLRVVFTPQQQPTNVSVDRDEPAAGALEPILLSITVVVTDVNDHAPTFPQSRISFELGETSAAPETTTIPLPMAADPDAGENGTISYWLEERPGGAAPPPPQSHRVAAGYSLLAPALSPNPWNSTFPFRLEGPHEGGQPMHLRLISALDYEQVKAYDFVLHAEDHGRPNSLSSQLAIHIDVLDENDNPPIFERIHNFVIINESLPRGSVLLDLRASDADSSRNGQVSFEIPMAMTEEENVVKQFFEVRTVAPGYAKLYLRQPLDLDQEAGELRSLAKLAGGLGALDGEDLSVRRSRDYHIRIQATDNGSPRRQSADAYVTVRALDVNDMVPRISITYINTATLTNPQQTGGISPIPSGFSGTANSALYSRVQRGHGVIPENTERRFLALVTVQDLDSGPWGQVRCRTDNDAFQLVPIGQAGVASGVLEAPHTSYFGGEAAVDTSGSGGGGGTVSANQEITFKLVAIKAFDREVVEQITFRVLCVDNFVKNGQLQTFVENLQPPESVTKQQSKGPHFGTSFLSRHPGVPYTVVTDRAKRLTGTATVSVRVLDENDCVPEFTQSLYSFSVEENVPEFSKHTVRKLSDSVAGHPIGTIGAVDRDLTSRLTYQLQSNPLEAFALDAQTGVLTVVRPFDQEALFSSAYEGVEIRKLKETSGGSGNESIVLVHLAASVSDGLHSANTQIQVVILDVNDCPPVFERSNYEFYAQENERPSTNQPVGRVRAQDADAGFNGRILYRLDALGQLSDKTAVNGSQLVRDYNPIRFFKIDRDSGTLHILRPLDREQYSHHIFYVLAIDTSNKAHYQVHPLTGDTMWSRGQYHSQQSQQKQPNHFTATATVTVIVTDVNDNAPTISFPTPHSTLTVEAGAPAGQHIFTVAASDPDLGENSTIRFTLRQSTLTLSDADSARAVGSKTTTEMVESIASNAKLGSSSSSVFSIDEHAGIVFLTEKLPNKAAKHLLIIGAHDLGSVQKNTSVAAIINVVQKNTFDPSLLLDLGSQYLKNEQPELMGPHSEQLGAAQSNQYGMNQPMGQQNQQQHNQQQQQQQQQQQRQQHYNRDRDLTQGDQGISPVYMFTDRVIIFVFSAIFVVLLIVTMVLIFLIRRRRFMEMHPVRTNKDPGKLQVRSNMEGPVLQCTTNSLQLIHPDGGAGTTGKATVFFRKEVPSDGTSQADSDGRSGLGTDSYPQQTLITSEDSYTLLKTLGRNQMTTISAGELAPSVCKAYGHCLPLTSFAPVVQVNNGMQTRGTYLGQSVMPGFAPIFPMPAKISSAGGYVSMPKPSTVGGQPDVGQRTVSPDHLIFTTQFTSPKRMQPSGQQSPFNELPNFLPGLEEGRRSEYQKLIQPKTGPLVGRVSNLRRPLNPQKDHEHGILGSELEAHRWLSSEDVEMNDEADETEEEDEAEGHLTKAVGSEAHRRSSFRMKAATLQALHRSTSSDWHLPNTTVPCDVQQQQQKFVKFSTSNISLNKLPSPPMRKNPTESHYV